MKNGPPNSKYGINGTGRINSHPGHRHGSEWVALGQSEERSSSCVAGNIGATPLSLTTQEDGGFERCSAASAASGGSTGEAQPPPPATTTTTARPRKGIPLGVKPPVQSTSSAGSARPSPKSNNGLPRADSNTEGGKCRVHAVQIDHTGQHKEISEASTRATKHPQGTTISKDVSLPGLTPSGLGRHRTSNPIEMDELGEPTPILSPPTCTRVSQDDARVFHKPRTHSMQSLFKRTPVSRVVKHVPSRHHRQQEQPLGTAAIENFPTTPTSPDPVDAGEYVTIEKQVMLYSSDEKLGVQWHGVAKGSILVGTVKPDGAADRAGVRESMRLLAIDGVKILDRRDLEKAIGPEGTAMGKLKAGETITLRLEVKKESTDDTTVVDIDHDGSDTNSSYDVEYNVRLLAFHPIFEATWLPCLTAVLAHTAFYQLPLVIGHIGVFYCLLVIAVVALISLLSLASVSALMMRKTTTNDLENLGPYHMLSRHVGTEYGGAVGVFYWLVLTLLCSLHSQGIAEALYWYWDIESYGIDETLSVSIIAWSLQIIVVILISHGVTYVSVMELSSVILTAGAFLTGMIGLFNGNKGDWAKGPPRWSALTHNWLDTGEGTDTMSLYEAFTRIFPACLGILVVLGRATDMKEPEKELPSATFKAMVFCWVVLTMMTLLLGSVMVVERDNLNDGVQRNTTDTKAIMYAFAEVSWPSPGVFETVVLIAILVQCIQSLIIAPHVLSAIARDHIAPILDTFQVGAESSEQPLRALLFSSFISSSLVPIRGHLYTALAIASLITLMLINGVAGFETMMESGNTYRSSDYKVGFVISWKVSLVGFILCAFALFSINWYAALTALIITLGLAKYLEMRSDCSYWGEGVKGVQLQHALEKLLSLEATREQTKNWRPQVMVLLRLDQHGNVAQPRLFSVAEQLKAGKGLVIFVAVVEGDPIEKREQVLHLKRSIKDQLDDLGIAGFCKVVAAPNALSGYGFVMQGIGLGALSPNTVLATWPDDWRTRPGASMEFSSLLHTAHELSKAVVVVKGIRNFPITADFVDVVNSPLECDHIDLWWIVHDGGIELLLAFLLRQHSVWKRSELRIFTIIPAEDDTDSLAQALSKELARLRIDAVLIVHPVEGEWIREFICTQEEEAEVKSRVMEQLQLTEDERAHEVDTVLATHHRTCSRTPVTGSPAQLDHNACSSTFPRGSSHGGFDGFPMVELNGERSHPKRLDQSLNGVPSVSYHFECLNELISEHSTSTDLVLISLPDSANFYTPDEFMDCMEKMIHGISRAMLIRGTGEQVITGYW